MKREYFNANWILTKGAAWFAGVKDTDLNYVTLPHDAMIMEERSDKYINKNNTGFFPGGIYTYNKTFDVPADFVDKTVYFEFEGIQLNAMVYINGDFAGKCLNGYTNFYIKANKFLKYGEKNSIKVVAKTSNEQNSRWYTGSGIYRNVKMITAEKLHVKLDGIKIKTPDISVEEALIEINTTIENEDRINKNIILLSEIIDTDGTVVAKDVAPMTLFTEEELTIRQRISLNNPKLWDTETPNLYICHTKVMVDEEVIDEEITSFGIRKLQLDTKHGLRINGKVVNLRGACLHHDNGVIGAATFEDAEERRIRILKEAGFNSIRSAHNPMSKAMLDACDKYGMLVMEETFDTWNVPKSDYDYALYFNECWEKDLESIVHKDFNHPSVIIYSIGNEIVEAGTKLAANINLRMVEKLREIDDTRYTINSINGMFTVMHKLGQIIGELEAKKNKTIDEKPAEDKEKEINNMMSKLQYYLDDIMSSDDVTKATQEVFAGCDIAGYNYMTGRYENDENLFPNRIICGSETAPKKIDQNWKYVKEKPHIIGDFVWIGWDYLGESGVGKHDYTRTGNCGIYGPYPYYIAYCGDIDITGHRRPQSYYREIVWGLRKEPYITVQRPQHYGKEALTTQWSWSDSISSWTWPKEYEEKPIIVEVYSDAEEIELFINENSIGRMEAGEKNRFKSLFETIYKSGEIVAVAYEKGIEVSRTKLKTMGEVSDIKLKTEKSKLLANGRDLAYVNISLVDENGNLNTNEEKKVSIKIEGQGEIQGFGSADPKSLENFFDKTRTTFDGKLLVVVRSGFEKGIIKLTASMDGNIFKTIEIEVV